MNFKKVIFEKVTIDCLEFVKLGGLPMLMAVYQELKSNANVSKMVCRIISRITSHPEYLPELFASGKFITAYIRFLRFRPCFEIFLNTISLVKT